ncbi:hypothetical protein HAX54_004609 [Datura stramonium]|uniref:Uncharacterized protein n=1 Tax=Datura stramonium TaxID=4076 RepID=A0ABS8T7B0_DATST|nr:hypothetical protein [Datura stramonium]
MWNHRNILIQEFSENDDTRGESGVESRTDDVTSIGDHFGVVEEAYNNAMDRWEYRNRRSVSFELLGSEPELNEQGNHQICADIDHTSPWGYISHSRILEHFKACYRSKSHKWLIENKPAKVNAPLAASPSASLKHAVVPPRRRAQLCSVILIRSRFCFRRPDRFDLYKYTFLDNV